MPLAQSEMQTALSQIWIFFLSKSIFYENNHYAIC